MCILKVKVEMKKKFDAVKMMRGIRNRLVEKIYEINFRVQGKLYFPCNKKYLNAPEAERKELEDIRRKYGIVTG